MGYSNINNLIKTLINNYTAPRININSSTLEDNLEEVLQTSSVAATKRNFWLNFLEFLNSEDNKIHMPLRQSDLDSAGSLGEFINNFADLTENSTDEIFGYIKELLNNSEVLNENDNHLMWNYSVNKLIYNVLDSYKRYNDVSFKYDGVIIWDDKTFPIIEITKADAGAAFNYNFDIDDITDELVIPWKNQDYMTFKDIMQSEFCISLNNDKKTQFTRSKSNSYDEWIRLLMPQNNKRVEVIDLDRNFWVISNVLSRICMYLFDEDSTIFSLFKQIINEIMQLWENILYLWIALATYCNTASSNIHIEFCPVPADDISHNAQYDNLPTSMPSAELTLKERLRYLIDKYPKRILVVIPFVRSSYIKQNLHRNITFSYILWYFPFDSDFSLATLKTENTSKITITLNSDSSVINTIGIKDYLVGYKDEVTRYKVSNCGLQVIENLYLNNVEQYRGVARLGASINITTDGQKLKINNFHLYAYDAIRQATNTNTNSFKILTLATSNKTLTHNDIIEMSISRNNKPTAVTSYASFSYKQPIKGFYIGECLTTTVFNKKVGYDIEAHALSLKPMAVDKIGEIPGIGILRNKDTSILKMYAEEKGTQTPDSSGKIKFKLYIGRHISGIHDGGDSSTGKYTWHEINDEQTHTTEVTSILYTNKGDEKTVVLTEDEYNDLTTSEKKNYEVGNHYIGAIGLCAALYNPIGRNEVLTYPRYVYQSEDGGVGFPTYCNEEQTANGWSGTHVYTFWNESRFFFYKKAGDEEYTKDNWFIRYVQVSGAYVLEYKDGEEEWSTATLSSAEAAFRYLHRNKKNRVSNAQTISWKDISKTVQFKYNNTDPSSSFNGKNYNVTFTSLPYKFITYKIDVHLFGPNNLYESATYRRKENVLNAINNNKAWRFLGTGDNLSDWTIGDETTSGFNALRTKLAKQYVLQLSPEAYNIYGTQQMPDFEVAKRDGLVNTERNSVTNSIEPMDTMPWE